MPFRFVPQLVIFFAFIVLPFISAYFVLLSITSLHQSPLVIIEKIHRLIIVLLACWLIRLRNRLFYSNKDSELIKSQFLVSTYLSPALAGSQSKTSFALAAARSYYLSSGLLFLFS